MIKILCVGKIKEKFFKEAVLEYSKRITKYSKVEIVEVPDIDLNNKVINLEKERDNLIKYITDKDYIITLEIDGKELNSEDLADLIDKTLMINSNIVFIIGGSNGLHEDIKKRSNFSLSFSRLTFPHQLFRVVLLEQIYRGFKIIKNESYHK